MHSDTQLFIDGQWRPGHGGQAPVLNPANEETDWLARGRRQGRPRRRLGGGFARICEMAQHVGLRAVEAHAPGRRAIAGAQRKRRARHDHGAGEAARRISDGSRRRRRRHRLVGGGRPTRLRPHRPRARAKCQPNGGQGAGRPGRRLLALEFPDQSGGAQDFRSACGGMLDHHQGPGGYAHQLRRAGRRFRRRRPAARRAQPRVRRPGDDQRLPHPASGDQENLVHGIDRRRQTACVACGSPHETGDDGAWRPRAGDRVRRR